jgi:RNA polymerase sigma-70 factor, ECF subfamily
LPAAIDVAKLVAGARAGEREAFSALVAAHLRAAYLTALAIVGRPGDAEDVAQDAFLIAFEKLDTCREPARFSGWLLRIVRNRALNWVDQRRHREGAGFGEQDGADRGESTGNDPGLKKRLLEALSGLTTVQREIVLLHDLEEWTHGEIAQALEISETTCRQHLFQGRRKMRVKLSDLAPKEVENG